MSHRVRSSVKKNTVVFSEKFLQNHRLNHSEASVNFIKTRTYLPISCQISFFPNFVLSCNLKERNCIRHLDSIYNRDKQTWLHTGSVSFTLTFIFYYFLSNRELKSSALWQPRGVGGMYKSEGTYIYILLIHTDIWQKPAQNCKAVILQSKKKKCSLIAWNIQDSPFSRLSPLKV